ncbi:MAG: HNH endonuclease [Bacteroidales bacterium]|nr:HNH endonuclease [Bacteroidales bacterium]
MTTIENIDELKHNLETFEKYLKVGSNDEIELVKGYVKRGRCFVSYKLDDKYKFVPSRFVGYYDNSLEKHSNNLTKDGRKTNPAINKIAERKLSENDILEEKYKEYCESLGINPKKNKRKFWSFKFGNNDFEENINTNEAFPEGKIIERKHIARERNSVLIENAKQIFKKKCGKLFCQICGFDFETKYGELGKDYIEAHHTIPISEMEKGHKTTIDEIVLVCSNCHKMLHRKRPLLNADEIKKVLK